MLTKTRGTLVVMPVVLENSNVLVKTLLDPIHVFWQKCHAREIKIKLY